MATTPVAAASASAWSQAFLKSLGVIAASEVGDKTFFIAAVMAMKSSRWKVFSGALGALAAMTVLSALMGWAAPNLISKTYTHYAATALFFFFGFRMLYDVLFGELESELEEVEQELAGRNGADRSAADKDKGGPLMELASALLSPVFLKSFTLTFVAEWGDRSQIATIALAASQDVGGVIVGSVLGHAICTGAAVLGGRYLASHISPRSVNIFGGILFLLFGAHSLYTGPAE